MDHPPPKLVKLLEELGLATAAQVASVTGRARRLARQLPLVESVWIDALAQSRRLTAWQSVQLKAGRGERLRVGQFVLEQPLDWPDFGAAYRAREIQSRSEYRLVVLTAKTGQADPLVRCESLARRGAELALPGVAPIVCAGAEGESRFVGSEWVEGMSAAEWMIHHGRFPPQAVWEIARQMAAALAGLEKAGVCHGDLNPRGLLLTDSGQMVLLQPGLRAIVRPVEGCTHADLRPEAYDYLAPERVTGGPPTPASDLYAAGCVWWHLLAGRAPRGGGSSLAKLQAASSGRLPELNRLVQGVPQALAEAIALCTAREPGSRPQSFARLAALVGPSDHAGKACLRRCLRGTNWASTTFDPFPTVRKSSRPRGVLPVLGAGLLVVVAAAAGLVWQGMFGVAKKAEPQTISADMARPIPLPSAKPPADPGPVLRTAHVATVNPSQPPVLAASLELAAGARIGGAKRLQVVVPAEGWRVPVENVCFENVDFLWQGPASGARPVEAAIVRLHAGRAEFRGCSFRVASGPAPPAAIRWAHPADGADSLLVLPSGRLRFADCVFESVDAAVDCRTRGAIAVEFSNTLELEGGPLVRAHRWPTAEESLRITLQRTTLRNTGGVLQCRYEAEGTSPGAIVIQTVESGLFPRSGQALLALAGAEPPGRLLEAVEWSGQGSLMGLRAAVAAWLSPDGAAQPVDDARLAISGLARSEVQFAGPATGGPEANRIIQWQGPLRSPDPPGVDASRLPAKAPGSGR